MTVPEVDKKLCGELEAPEFSTSQATCLLHFFDGEDIAADKEDMYDPEKDRIADLTDFAEREQGLYVDKVSWMKDLNVMERIQVLDEIMILGVIRCTVVDLFESALMFKGQKVAIGIVWIVEDKDSLKGFNIIGYGC
ncbi:hypothetical protein V6N11_037992 [Hibiscus sabdariffa]|uniref:Uncharacterized protein n=1 Tax=Hibiscus sabdariffa TaxID=183260 RepID=A0ABR1ZY49_9ROSI